MMPQKRIMIIMPELFHGGAERQFRLLAEGLLKKGYIVSVVVEHCLHDQQTEEEKSYLLAHSDIEFIHAKKLSIRKGRIQQVISFFRMNHYVRKYLLNWNPDVVIVYSSIGIKSIPVFRNANVRVIYSERNEASEIFFIKNGSFVRKANCVICNSLHATENYHRHRITASYVANGILKSDMLPLQENDTFEILVPARVAPIKNQLEVVKAAAVLKNENIHYTFVGQIEDEKYLLQLREEIERFEIGEKISILPFAADMKSLYLKADLVLLPSLSEGLSNVILESYMYGRRCLLSDIPMNRKCSSSEQFFFPLYDTNELVKSIERERKMSIEEKQISIKRNHDFVLSKYSVESMIAAFEKCF